jgi:hypothetical protein
LRPFLRLRWLKKLVLVLVPVGAGVSVGESHRYDRDRDRTTVIKEREPSERTTVIKKENDEGTRSKTIIKDRD